MKKNGGKREGAGRKKGVPNKLTTDLKEMILRAAEKAGGKEGTEGYLATQAIQNPNAFMSLLGKALPLTVVGDKDNPLSHNISVSIKPVSQK